MMAGSVDPEEFFFRQETTLKSLRLLTQADELVFYCGAGVSIDRTGLSWSQLVDAVFRNAYDETRKKFAKSIQYLVKYLDDPRQSASIVVQAYKPAQDTETDFLKGILRKILYKDSGWDRGLILRNLTTLAIVAAASGRKVTIVTTNYDDLIEVGLRDRVKRFKAQGGKDFSAPGIRRRVLRAGEYAVQKSDDQEWITVATQGVGSQSIDVIYLHGRVSLGETEGDIVLTEGSYALTMGRSTQILTEVFSGERKGILTVGAGLTDEPLIHALSATRSTVAERNERFALYSMPTALIDVASRSFQSPISNVQVDDVSIGHALDERGKHLGIEMLRPISHMQTAQYLEELRVQLVSSEASGNEEFYAKPENGVNYSARLDSWHLSWSQRAQAASPEFRYSVLDEALSGIRLRMSIDAKVKSGEKLRLEAWARIKPSSSNRRLTMIATSAGPLMDSTLYDEAEVKRSSSNASVRTFLQGRPQKFTRDDLGLAASASRWQTFIGFPIFIEVPFSRDDVTVAALVPVGVITLTSDRSDKETDTAPESVFTEASLEDMNYVRNLLLSAGTQIFGITDSV